MIFYPNPVQAGTNAVNSLNDGYSITVSWFKAQHSVPTRKIAYHIYYATVKENVFTEGVKYVSLDGSLQANIIDLVPGQMYWFSVRPIEYDPTLFNLAATLPVAHDNLRVYPSSILRKDITATDLIIPLLDVTGFPNVGVVQIGVELVLYLSVDSFNKNLIVAGGTAVQNAKLVDQGGGNYYLPVAGNVGNGTITGLTLLNTSAKAETWTIRCIENKVVGYTLPKFEAFGSISGNILDGYGNPTIWEANGITTSNSILNFAISDGGTSFRAGDSFIVKVAGAVSATNGRGYNNGVALPHTVSGFDGYDTWDPTVIFHTIGESKEFDRIFACQNRFDYSHEPFTIVDGYHQVLKDLLSTDLVASDADNVDFPMYDYSGYHRTDPVQLLNGTCVGSYIGGEQGCIDGYGNIQITRGLSLQDQNTQRQDVLLSVTGRPAVLIKRVQTGITCSCYLASSEYQDDRCPKCYGTKFVFGYEQYFNPRRSDGRILVRPGPTDENSKMYEAGLESEFPLSLWTITVPTIKTRDVLILFDIDNNEEFRYEVASVTRNNTIIGQQGGQLLKVNRIRKYDPAYQIRAFRDTSTMPSKLNTSIGFVPGIPPHSHEITRNQTDPSNWSQTTSVSQGHNHPVLFKDGQLTVMIALGHDHKIIV